MRAVGEPAGKCRMHGSVVLRQAEPVECVDERLAIRGPRLILHQAGAPGAVERVEVVDRSCHPLTCGPENLECLVIAGPPAAAGRFRGIADVHEVVQAGKELAEEDEVVEHELIGGEVTGLVPNLLEADDPGAAARPQDEFHDVPAQVVQNCRRVEPCRSVPGVIGAPGMVAVSGFGNRLQVLAKPPHRAVILTADHHAREGVERRLDCRAAGASVRHDGEVRQRLILLPSTSEHALTITPSRCRRVDHSIECCPSPKRCGHLGDRADCPPDLLGVGALLDRLAHRAAERCEDDVTSPRAGVAGTVKLVHALPEVSEPHGRARLLTGRWRVRGLVRVNREARVLSLDEVVRHRVHDIGEGNVKGPANSGEELARSLFLASLHLGEVAEGDCRGRRDVTQRAPLILTPTTKLVTDDMPKNDHEPTSLPNPRSHGIPAG